MSISTSFFLPDGNSVPEMCCWAWRRCVSETHMLLLPCFPHRPPWAQAILYSTARWADWCLHATLLRAFKAQVWVISESEERFSLSSMRVTWAVLPRHHTGSLMGTPYLCSLTWAPTTSLQVPLCLTTSLTGKAQGHWHPLRCWCKEQLWKSLKVQGLSQILPFKCLPQEKGNCHQFLNIKQVCSL